MDYTTLTCEFLVALRGKSISQLRLSKLLGYNFNKIFRWENGEDIFYWTDFVKLCKALRIPLDEKFEKSFFMSLSQNNLSTFLQSITKSSERRGDLEHELGISRFQLMRWTKQGTRIPFPIFLAMVDFLTPRLTAFLSNFVPLNALASLYDRLKVERETETLALNHPYFEAVLCALAAHAPSSQAQLDSELVKKLSSSTGVSTSVVTRVVECLEQLGIVDVKNIKKTLNQNRVVLVRQRVAATRLNSYWLTRVCDYLSQLNSEPGTQQPALSWGLRTLLVDNATRDEIARSLASFYANIDKLVAGQSVATKKEVMILASQLFNPSIQR